MSNEVCPTVGVLTDERMDRVLTQYRESPNLLGLIRNYLEIIEELHLQVCDLPSNFDIDTAVGDQLTILGKRLGFPRTHSVCNPQPVHGFDDGVTPSRFNLTGFGEPAANWIDDAEFYQSNITITNDETYRRFLKVRRYQMFQLYDLESVDNCVKILWGEQAVVAKATLGRVVIAPQRDLTSEEEALKKIYPRVIPVAPGLDIRFHFKVGNMSGFGEGFDGFYETEGDEKTSYMLNIEDVRPYEC